MKNLVLSLAAAVSISTAAQSETITFTGDMLKQGAASQGDDCISVGLSLNVTATKGGRIRTYSTNASGFSSGIYIGAVQGQVDTTNNKTAPKYGTYRITFSRPVTSVELKIDAISNMFAPAESLYDFRTSNGAAQINFQPTGNTASFDATKQVITATARNGDGVITHTAPGKFSYFEFAHEQHPRNIGFIIANIKATPAPFACP